MSAPAVQEEIKTRAAALRAADTSLSQADAEKKAREEIENEFRNGTGTPPKTKVELTQDEKDKIEEAADKEAKAEVEAKYKADALAQAEKDLKDKGEWDAAVEKAKEEILKGTDEGKAALDQVKAEIAKKSGVSVKALDMVEKLVNARRDEIRAENAAANPPITADEETILEDAFKTVKFTVNVGDDSYYQLTAMNFSILAAMELDPSRLANRYDKGDGVEQNDLLNDLKNLATDKEKMSFRGCSASEFLQCVLSDVALNAQRANTFSQSFKDIAGTIDTQRMSISGVDEDEEAVDLVKYQNGYNLASKMIQTLTEIYDRLILETGV